ncbi:NAD(P)/FAD-dependent oxidoreductase [Chitinasiproducens palmae]|uniref:NADH dehydrogenase n=1 Tax=Chitinasiproducens palmae TaxID=1770053 RepID=A0A1H2PVD7_9BURK|nr:NAD(P)/FAD-dependent oxidoreductase [Chitinasiproducens palmae]SDV50391.1 NADH dehydrogenase [Chitinasiproducens palmae]
MHSKKKIVIVGGGIAGLMLATRLGHALGRTGQAEVTLVDKSAQHVWKPMLHTFAAGTASIYQQRVSFVQHAHEHGFHYWPGEMSGLDTTARRIRLAPLVMGPSRMVVDARELDYDVLVLAVGSRANDFQTPGAVEHARFVDDLNQARLFNDALRAEVLRSVSQHGVVDLAIVGAGATGVQLAAEVSMGLELANAYATDGGDMRSHLRTTLIESGPRILPAFPEDVSQPATVQLGRLGVTVMTDARVARVNADSVELADGARLPATITVWAAGVRAPDFLNAVTGLDKTRGGQLLVDPTLLTSDPHIFAMGDCASQLLPGHERPLAPTAQVARQQARHLARHLPGWLEGKAIPPFDYREYGSVVSLGHYDAYGMLAKYGLFKGAFLRGRMAQLSHTMLYRTHQLELHGWRRGMLTWFADWINRRVQPKVKVD